MRRILALVLLAALALPAPATAVGQIIDIAIVEGGSHTINVEDHEDDVIRFSASFADAPSIAAVELSCTCNGTAELIELTMQNSGGTWSASLSANHAHLVAGDWHVNATGVDQNGDPETVGPHKLTIVVPDGDDPRITVAGGNGTVKLGADDTMRIGVSDAFLRQVTYRIEGMPFALPLQAPYSLAVDRFETGAQNVTFNATDRAGNAASRKVTVFADDVAPEITADMPPVLYRGVPNPLHVRVKDDSPFTLTAKLGTATAVTEAGAGEHELLLNLTPTGSGSVLELSVVDELLNVATLRQDVEVRALETDVRMHSAKLLPGSAIPGENRTLVIEADVLVSPVPVVVDVMHGGRRIGEITLDNQTTKHEIKVELPPGPNHEPLSLRVPPGVVELVPGNQTLSVGIEFFVGRVLHGNHTYHIRVDGLGRPQEAVRENSTYAIEAVDKGLATVYQFMVDGAALQWDPFHPETHAPVVDDTPDNRDTPLPLAVLLVALAIVTRRR